MGSRAGRFASFLLLSLLAPLPRGEAADPAPPEHADSAQQVVDDHSVQRKRTICGLNALYMLLRLRGVAVEFGQVERLLPTEARGTSLLHLRETAGRFGTESQVRKCTLSALDGMNFPLIAHFRMPFAGGSSLEHYVVVLHIDRERVTFVDGTTGRLVHYPREQFSAYWTGYVLEPTGGPSWASWGGGLLLLVGAGAALTLWLPTRRRSAPATAALTSLVLFSGYSLAAPDQVRWRDDAPDQVWRLPQNDAGNCLYVQLALCGRSKPYDAVTEILPPRAAEVNLLDLRQGAQACGLPMRVIRCKPGELTKIPMPVIVHLQDPHGEAGGYYLLLQMGARECELFSGATARLQRMSTDDFRRRWSGYALVPEAPRSYWMRFAAAGLGIVTVYGWWRFMKPRRVALHPAGPG